MRFRRAPLLAAGAAFAIGIGVTTWSAQPFVLLLAALTAFTTLALVSLRLAPRTAISPVLAAWLVLGMLAGEFQPSPAPSDPLLVFADNLSRTVEGRVIRVVPPLAAPTAANDEDAVPPWESTEDTASETGKPMQVDLEVNRIERVTPDISQMVPVSGVVRIAVYEPPSGLLSLACGERLRMPLRLRTADTFRDPGVFQYATLPGRDGITAEAPRPRCPAVSARRRPGPPAGCSPWWIRVPIAFCPPRFGSTRQTRPCSRPCCLAIAGGLAIRCGSASNAPAHFTFLSSADCTWRCSPEVSFCC
jgi:hypothetical protein